MLRLLLVKRFLSIRSSNKNDEMRQNIFVLVENCFVFYSPSILCSSHEVPPRSGNLFPFYKWNIIILDLSINCFVEECGTIFTTSDLLKSTLHCGGE